MKIYFLVFVLYGIVTGNEDDLRVIDSIVQEMQCMEAGGICTVSADCPEGLLSERRGLCPTQRQLGIECCHGISIKETRCNQHGGSCVGQDTYCNPIVVFAAATDCADDQQCCIMV